MEGQQTSAILLIPVLYHMIASPSKPTVRTYKSSLCELLKTSAASPPARWGFPGEQVRASLKPSTHRSKYERLSASPTPEARTRNAWFRLRASSYCVHSLRPAPCESEVGYWAVFPLDILLRPRSHRDHWIFGSSSSDARRQE